MAKKKRSAALFEVMVKQESRRLPRPPGVFRTLFMWFKNRPKAEPAPALVGVVSREEVAAPVIEAPAPQPRQREVEYVAPVPQPQSVPIYDDPRPSGAAVKREGGEIAMRVSYGTAIIGAFALATVLITVFLAGRKWSNHPQTVLAPTTTSELRRQTPRPNLTDVRRVSVPAPAAVDFNAEPPDVTNNAAASGVNPAGNAPARSKERTVGLNYVLVQGYADDKMAQQAVTILMQNGIECTVEKSIPNFMKYSVVGQIGFSRVSNNPQLDAYLSKIMRVSDLYVKKPNSFLAFKPMPFKWQAWQRKTD
jgi:hypothetical protein